MENNRLIQVGFYVKPEKWKKMEMPSLVETAKKHNIEITQLNLNKSIESQGDFDIILHKSIDLFVQTILKHNNEAETMLSNFQRYIQNHPNVPVCNRLEFDSFVISRRKIHEALSNIDFQGDCLIPDLSYVCDKYIVKPDLSCGDHTAHEFRICTREEINNYSTDEWVVQPYYNTKDAVLKVHCIGNSVAFKLKNSENIEYEFNNDTVVRIAEKIRSSLKCDLFGFDIVRDVDLNQNFLVDLNSFSGIEAMPQYEILLIRFIAQFFKNKTLD